MTAPAPARRALVVYGSETGNAQDVAEELGRIAQRLRFDTDVAELNAISLVCARGATESSTLIHISETTAAIRCRSDLNLHHRPGRAPCQQPEFLESPSQRPTAARVLAAADIYFFRPWRYIVPKVSWDTRVRNVGFLINQGSIGHTVSSTTG